MSTEWLIVDDAAFNAILALNSQQTDDHINLSPTPLTDGRRILNPDLLDDCGPGETWEAYATILQGLSQATLDPSTLLPQIS